MLDMYIEAKKNSQDFDIHKIEIFPNSLSIETLFGSRDITTEEWKEGILISHIKKILDTLIQKGDIHKSKVNKTKASQIEHSESSKNVHSSVKERENKVKAFYVFDGEIELTWMDNLTTAFDMEKNSISTGNSEKILVPMNLHFIFLCPDLSKCTPAIVSRLGIIHIENSEGKNFGFQDMITKKIKDFQVKYEKHPDTSEVMEKLTDMFNNTLTNMLTDKRKSYKFLFPISKKDIANNIWMVLQIYLTHLYSDEKRAAQISLAKFDDVGVC